MYCIETDHIGDVGVRCPEGFFLSLKQARPNGCTWGKLTHVQWKRFLHIYRCIKCLDKIWLTTTTMEILIAVNYYQSFEALKSSFVETKTSSSLHLRHSTGFQRDHTRLVDCASPGMTISGKTSRRVESRGKRHFSWWPTEMNGEVGLPIVLDTGWTKV